MRRSDTEPIFVPGTDNSHTGYVNSVEATSWCWSSALARLAN